MAADRDLRRRARQPDSPEARAEWLRARLRAGTLAYRQVRVAALLGAEEALLVVPAGERLPAEWLARDWWRSGGCGPELARQLILAATRAVLGVWEAWDGVEFAPREALRAALDAWDTELGGLGLEQRQELCDVAVRAVEDAAALFNSFDRLPPPSRRALSAGRAAVRAVIALGELAAGQRTAEPHTTLARSAGILGEAELQKALRESLVSWLYR